MDNKTGLLGNISNAFGGRQGLLMSGLPMMFGTPQMQQQALMQGLQHGGTMQAENRKTQQAEAKRNQTLEFLKKVNPELAQAVEANAMTATDAYSTHLKAEAPQKPQKPTSLMQEYNLAKEQGFQGDFLGYQQARKGKGFSVTTADGTVVQMGGGNEPKDMKEAQAKANIYASRMENSNQILERLETEGTSLTNKIASGLPLGNYALSPEYRQYDQAKRDFINATLRQESGAVIADSEFANGERQYFPQPGDDPQTIAQKKENRRIAMIAIRQASGQPETSPTFAAENPVMPDFSTMSDEELEAIANGQ
jgi:hypothetical protein